MSKTIILIDGDILLYKAITTAENEIEFEPDMWVMYCDHRDAQSNMLEMVDNICKHVPNGEPYLCLTDKNNFRKDVYPAYKSNRKNLRKPMGFIDFRAWVQATYTCIMKPTLEADDCIGILATKPGANCVIVSGDKDLKQIPGKHLMDGGIGVITEGQGEMLFYTQTLTGDAVDGYPGCPGIGPVKAQKLLQDFVASSPLPPYEAIWNGIVKTYEKAGLTEDDALRQARCARILQWRDWSQDKQAVRLWTPHAANAV